MLEYWEGRWKVQGNRTRVKTISLKHVFQPLWISKFLLPEGAYSLRHLWSQMCRLSTHALGAHQCV